MLMSDSFLLAELSVLISAIPGPEFSPHKPWLRFGKLLNRARKRITLPNRDKKVDRKLNTNCVNDLSNRHIS